MTGPISQALADFRAKPQAAGWLELPFFQDGSAETVAAKVDAVIASGAQVLPPPEAVFTSIALTPLDRVKVVILGQDPYPTPGDSHGLAFSYRGSRRLPASLRTILTEMAEDLGVPMPKSGDLSKWAKQGVLLINTALTVEAGQSGAHMKFGWSALVDQAIAAVSERQPAAVFLLWGAPARKRAALVDRTKHLVIEAGHPSPLNRLNDFRGTRPFSRANAWLAEKGLERVDWRLEP
ncbi:uracil-DNA glycosylase [Microvirga lotononidis]|uniref:Uracil-DNA glycosylase n=1 Tax=Microvirga lotononidis TaxID=864069 RepID=I4YTL6_9HYPH|nr:uracil-DNA glycosylase [Microvirga lotononidis]EIM27308.1 uracil-DNA glycosylase [Microvirga lotononidis]WQO28520.1 uracil-DNA glycosylase [Microvirga lotononidis]